MPDENISQKADDLRKRLRDGRTEIPGPDPNSNPTTDIEQSGRIGINAPSTVVQRYSPIGNPEDRGAEQPQDATTGRGDKQAEPDQRSLHGQGSGNFSIGRTTSESKGRVSGSSRSTTQNDQRVRSEPGRHGENYSTDRSVRANLPSGGGSSSVRPKRVGNLVRNEQEEPTFIPARTFSQTTNPEIHIVSEKPNIDTSTAQTNQERSTEGTPSPRKRGRPRTKSNVIEPPANEENKQKGFRERVDDFMPRYSGNRLTQHEADEMKKPLASALEDMFEQADKFLMSYCGLLQVEDGGQPVWSDVSEKEMKAFVNSWLSLGQKSSIIAGTARGAVGFSDFIVGAAVMGPRLQKTGQLIRETREYRMARRENAQTGRKRKLRVNPFIRERVSTE